MRFAPVQDARFGRSIEAARRYNANGYKLAGAVRQFCVINALVVIHTASVFVIILAAGGLPPVSCKGEFVGAIVAAACAAVHLLLDKSLYLFFVQDFPGFRQVLHGCADRCRDGRCMGISGGVVLLNFGLDQLHQSLHLRAEGNFDFCFVRDCNKGSNLNFKISVHAGCRDFDSTFILHDEQQHFGIIIQAAIYADLVHDVSAFCSGNLDADFPGRFLSVLYGVNRKDGQFVRFAADGRFCRQVGFNDAGAAHGAGDGERAAGEGFRQERGTGSCITGFFPAHVVCPPILMVTVSCVCASPPVAYACAVMFFGWMAPGSSTVVCIRAALIAPAT